MDALVGLALVVILLLGMAFGLAEILGWALEGLLNLTPLTYDLKFAIYEKPLDFIAFLLLLIIVLVSIVIKREKQLQNLREKQTGHDGFKKYAGEEKRVLEDLK